MIKRKPVPYLGNEIKNIKAGEVFVIDVATISSFEEQAFVVGDVMKSIDEMYSSRYYNLEDEDRSNNSNKNGNKSIVKITKKSYIIF